MRQVFQKERILIVTEAVAPQINGVVRTVEATNDELRRLGHEVLVISPDTSRRATLPSPEPHIYLEFFARSRITRLMDEFDPTHIHIATEGPLGRTARAVFRQAGRTYTTAVHSRWPEFAKDRAPRGFKQAALTLSYAALRRFHAGSSVVMATTPSMMRELQNKGFRNLKLWERAVDTGLFKPGEKSVPAYQGLPRPLLLYFGRVAHEKNIPAFLDLKTTGSKIVIGDGKAVKDLRRRYPDAHYLGAKTGADLARHCAAADLCVFPSRNDTFGLTLLEAAAMGLRIAAYPVPGPIDILGNDAAKAFAALDDNLQKAADDALALPDRPAIAREFILSSRYSWAACTRQFLHNLRTAEIS